MWNSTRLISTYINPQRLYQTINLCGFSGFSIIETSPQEQGAMQWPVVPHSLGKLTNGYNLFLGYQSLQGVAIWSPLSVQPTPSVSFSHSNIPKNDYIQVFRVGGTSSISLTYIRSLLPMILTVLPIITSFGESHSFTSLSDTSSTALGKLATWYEKNSYQQWKVKLNHI